MHTPNIVLIGGGTGSFTLLQGLKQLTPHITAIVNMSDDGGSTGTLRDELGVLPPGDIRQCLVALSDQKEARDLFSYRFPGGSFRGQSLGNMILSGLELQYGSLEEAIRIASKLLDITGQVVPVTLTKHNLMLKDGRKTVRGQDRVSNHRLKHPENHRLWLEPAASINPLATRAIAEADLVVIAPGRFYGSLLPIFLVDGVAQALQSTPAPVVSVTNLMNNQFQTEGWHVADYVRGLEYYLGAGTIDTVLYNSEPVSDELLKRYAQEGEYPVRTEPSGFVDLGVQTIGVPLVAKDIYQQDPADTMIRRTLIRHDPEAVVGELRKLLQPRTSK
jgi:uncharacterized cofD-like protein